MAVSELLQFGQSPPTVANSLQGMQYSNTPMPTVGNMGNMLNPQGQPGMLNFGQGSPSLAGGGAAGGGSWWDNILGDKGSNTLGWGKGLLDTATGVGNLWLGGQQLKLGKQALKQDYRKWKTDTNNQVTLTNADLSARQDARVASNPGHFQSTAAYMEQNKLDKVG